LLVVAAAAGIVAAEVALELEQVLPTHPGPSGDFPIR
jgi:hypothetical protein